MVMFLLFVPTSTNWLGWCKDRKSQRNHLGRFCDIYCAVILRYSFSFCVISDTLWSSKIINNEEQKACLSHVGLCFDFPILARIARIFVCNLSFSRKTLPRVFFRHFPPIFREITYANIVSAFFSSKKKQKDWTSSLFLCFAKSTKRDF